MGSIYNYHKIRFSAYSLREGDILVTNFYTDKTGKKVPVQSHLKLPRYSFFEILKCEKNVYYGREQEYRDAGYVDSFGGDFLQSPTGGHNIQKSFFQSPESRYMIAHWENLNHDEAIPNLVFTGDRPFQLSAEEQEIFMRLAFETQQHIENKLRKFIKNNEI